MKRYIKEIAVLAAQLLLFYLFPLFARPEDAMGMVLAIILGTFALSVVVGGISGERIKYLYPAAAAALFVPSVYIYYNESALVHSLWYLLVSAAGLAVGILIRKLTRKA